VLCALSGCALPKDQGQFAVGGTSSKTSSQFLSNTDLMVAGLVSESIGMGARGRLFDAESRLRKALVLAPDNDAVAFNLAAVLGQQGYADEALELVNTLRNKQGDLPHFMILSADVHNMRGEYDRAREDLKVAYTSYLEAQNFPRAAGVARSIANIAFASGHEQEALCYSYEAYNLSPLAPELGAHATVMVALNQHQAALGFVADQIQLDATKGAASSVHFANALAFGATSKAPEALRESEVALDLVADNPDIVSELNTMWWLLKQEVPSQDEDPRAAEAEQKMLESFFVEVTRLKERPPYSLVRWPPYFRSLLEKVEKPKPAWWQEYLAFTKSARQ
jgi:tetratricopeptide (TPR) repeat protein